MNTTIQIFENSEFGAIRTMSDQQGESLFCAKGAAEVLGHKKPENTMYVERDDGLKRNPIDSLGREQQITFINESGLYSRV